ncbi:MAG TPA: hypothetical protein VGB18_02635 [Candidatus Thermoplasmatota archaeon]
MQTRTVRLIGCATTALGFVLMALPLGLIEFSITCYIVAAGLIAAGVATWVPSAHRIGTLVGFAVAALASLHLVQLLIGATLDLTVFLLIATGFVGVILATANPHPWARASILIGAAGAITYLVHDIAVGYTGQLLADTMLTIGFAVLWYGYKPLAQGAPRRAVATG